MPSVLSPALQHGSTDAHNPDRLVACAMPKQETLEYLADMLRELSAIAAWANLEQAKKRIDDALSEVETKRSSAAGPMKEGPPISSHSSDGNVPAIACYWQPK